MTKITTKSIREHLISKGWKEIINFEKKKQKFINHLTEDMNLNITITFQIYMMKMDLDGQFLLIIQNMNL